MAHCEPIAKYDLDSDTWKKAERQDRKRALSVVKYDTCFGKKRGEDTPDFEYFILMGGMRPENYSKTGDETGWGIKLFLPEFEKLDSKIKVANVLIDNDAPLEKQTEMISKYVNELKDNPNCKRVHILGVSKCGAMLVALLKYLTESDLDKLNLMAYSAPYLGTIFASPETLYKRIDEVVGSVETRLLASVIRHLGKIKPQNKSVAAQALVDKIKSIHWNVFSQSHMDYDIAEIDGNGVPSQHKNRYDENFLNNMFNSETLDKLRKVKFTNVTTCSTERTLKNAVTSHNVNAGMLSLSSRVIFEEPSDGMVTLKSASYIEQVCMENSINISTIRVPDGHHDIASDPRIISLLINDRVLGIGNGELEK